VKSPFAAVSGPYSKDVNPWLQTELKRITGLSIDPRDLVRIFTVFNLSITCALNERTVSFCLMKDEVDSRQRMVAALKLEKKHITEVVFGFALQPWQKALFDSMGE